MNKSILAWKRLNNSRITEINRYSYYQSVPCIQLKTSKGNFALVAGSDSVIICIDLSKEENIDE